MKPVDLLKAMLLPVTELTVLLPIILFSLLTTFAIGGGVFGLFLLILLLPPTFRFQMIVLEASAKGVAPAPFDAENFSFAGSGWALFPLPLVVFICWLVYTVGARFGSGPALSVVAIAAALLPAMLAVLAITRSPLQSINPAAIGRLLKVSGGTFWIATVYLVMTSWLGQQLFGLPMLLAVFLNFLLTFSFFSVTGALVEPLGLIDDVYIPDAIEPDEREILGDVEKNRAAALAHAYGFISRDNRDGGFKHIFSEIEKDPDPVAAWAWYFDRMQGWEQQQHSLFFAQHYIHDMLAHGEAVPALKVIMRCRLIDERFKPLRDDLPVAIQAAENSGNIELATVLKQA